MSAGDSRLAIDAIRVLSMDAVQAAESGHPGTPMALAPAGYALFHHHLRHNPADPQWPDRDRFVLSVGHASMLLYSLLHLSGYEVSLDDLRDFRQWGSATPGHPEYGHTPGVETTTGPLGQGVGNSVGMALAERWMAERFNRPGHEVVDHYTYAFCSDGDLQEGISHEAAEFAGHQQLGKLTWVFDDNHITIEGDTALSTSVDQATRFRGYGWHVQTVEDGNDVEAIGAALDAAREAKDRPSLIVLRTIIGFGSPNMAGSEATHGAPLGADEVAATKENLDYPSDEPFHVPDQARAHWASVVERGQRLQSGWQARFAVYKAEHPELAAEFKRVVEGTLKPGWDHKIPDLSSVEKAGATRAWSGKVLQGIAAGVPELVGGSADLAGSNKTDIEGSESLLATSPGGRVIHFGIREHAMGSIMNGMSLHGGLRPFGGTFLIFSDYMRPAIRLASLMGQPVVYVFTHDSIGLGEDGPTHQPVEQLAALRAIPGLCDLRPGDAAETEIAWRVALERTGGPSFLSLTRQNVAVLARGAGEAGRGRESPGDRPTDSEGNRPENDRRAGTGESFASAEGLRRGAYVLAEAHGGEPEVILMASGSELGVAVQARETLQGQGVPTRVVSFPSWRLFEEQDAAYRERVLPGKVGRRVSIEAATTFGWSRWVGSGGASVGLDHFGASAPAERLFDEFGFGVDHVVEVARGTESSSAD